jgi:UDP-N-acetylmuramyl pentapeptide phosphotransferase/UDP-N-acetylglucosamine-1-phosphate transferase
MHERSFSVLATGTLILAAIASGLLVRAVRATARAKGVLDRPNERSSHLTPTPRGGGVGIVLVVLLWGLLVDLAGPGEPVSLWPFILATGCIGSLGLVDDVRGLSPLTRLAVQTAVALFTVASYGAFSHSPGPDGGLTLGVWGPVVTVVWIVGLVNAYNFMDGIDGIAAGQAAVAAGAWALLLLEHRDQSLVLLALAILGASIGFLWFNWSPASIFMGDVGSESLGYMFAALPLLARRTDSGLTSAYALFFAAAAVCPFVFDSLYTALHRGFRRQNLLRAHRSHLYQRLVIAGASHAQVATLYVVLAALPCALMLTAEEPVEGSWLVTSGIVGPLLALPFGVRMLEQRREKASNMRGDF